MSHVTGGGLANNLARVRAGHGPGADRPEQLDAAARVRPGRGRRPRAPADLEATLNLGVGMVALVPPDAVDDALRTLTERGLPAWVCGEAEGDGSGAGARVVLDGRHPAH